MPESYESLSDVREVLDRALESKSGVTVHFASRGDVTHFRQRINRARRLERELSRKIYSPSDPGFNACVYDRVLVVTDNVECKVSLVPRQASTPRGAVEVRDIE